MRLGYKKFGRHYFWLAYDVDIFCPVCNYFTIPIEQVWCGCKIRPRKLKKWCKKRRAAYQDNYEVYG